MKFLSQGSFTSHILHTIYRSDKMYQKIDKMIKNLEIRGRTPNTIKNMVWSIKNFTKFYNQPPELLGEQDIINYLDYCINQEKLCRGTVNTINNALKFFML